MDSCGVIFLLLPCHGLWELKLGHLDGTPITFVALASVCGTAMVIGLLAPQHKLRPWQHTVMAVVTAVSIAADFFKGSVYGQE